MRRLVALLLLSSICKAQAVPPDAAPPPHDASEFVVRITVNLVQVDAAVTDSRGRPVSDLKAEDFEVLQDGEPQKVTNFSYVASGFSSAPPAPRPQPGTNPPPPLATHPLKPEEVHRVIALVVDDLGLSFESLASLHDALRTFVDERMQPGDLVAIIRTSAGMGAFQQFTSDKQRLHAAIDQVRLRFLSRVGYFGFRPLTGHSDRENEMGEGPSPTLAAGNDSDPQGVRSLSRRPQAGLDVCALENVTTAGSLGAVRFVVEGLRELPGRKALVLFSENMKIFNTSECDYSQVVSSLRKLTDATERAGVVIYTVDPRGLQTLQFNAADDPLHPEPEAGLRPGSPPPDPQKTLSDKSEALREEYRESQEGLRYLAEETGGIFTSHNDIAGAVRDAVNDSGNYYLLGYHPPARTFDPNTQEAKFHKIKVRLKRPGLIVRSRNGFFGFAGAVADSAPASAAAQLARAMASPFTSSDIHVRLTALFSEPGTPQITGLLYIDGRDLTFTRTPDGAFEGGLDAVTFTFDVDGQVVSNTQRAYAIQIDPKGYDQVLRDGFVLKVRHPVKPGAYQVHVVVRDKTSQKIGSASQFVEVPNLKRGALALSGITLRHDGKSSLSGSSGGESPTAAEDPAVDEAIRIFAPGVDLRWTYDVFNAHKDPNGQPTVMTQMRLFRDAEEVFETAPTTLQWPATSAKGGLTAAGHLQLGSRFGPGNYVLQMLVTDSRAKTKERTASQWTDFEIKE